MLQGLQAYLGFGQVGDKSWGCAPSPEPVLPTDAMTGIVLKYAQEGLRLAKASNVTDQAKLADYANAALRAASTRRNTAS